MKKLGMMLVISVIVISFVCTGTVFAGKIGKRQFNQQKRICQGVKSGELNCREARVLEREQYHVQKCKGKAFKDGKVTPKERKRLRRKQNHASRRIYKMKHNEIRK